MGSHPINLGIRFLLELAALVAVGMWGWQQGEGWMKYVLAIGLPVIIAAVWGTFAVPDDPSRSGAAPVVVAGALRLLIEFAVFGFGAWALYQINYTTLSWVMIVVVVLHYAVSYDRIGWLLK